MTEKLKENWIRITYFVLSILILYIGIRYSKYIINNDVWNENFSYIGTLFTIVGLIVAIFEVFYSVNISKSVRDSSYELLNRVKQVEEASTVSDCISFVDETNRYVMIEDYVTALSNFQAFRKGYVKLSNKNLTNDSEELLTGVEKTLLKSTKTSSEAPLAKRQKDKLIDDILKIKRNLELANPANGRSK